MDENKLQQAVDIMIRTDRMHKSAIDSQVKAIGIHRTQHRILMHLARAERIPSQKELAEHLDITPAAVTGAVKRIEKDGYIKRTLGHDNRFYEITITDKGRAIVHKTHELFTRIDRFMFDGFTSEELDTYISCLLKLQENIKKHLPCAQCAERKGLDEKMV